MTVFSLISTLLLTNSALASVTKQFNYQGKLKNADGTLVTNGTYNIEFLIYDSLTSGNCLWSARGSCSTPTAKSVTASSGVFSTMLGESGDNTMIDRHKVKTFASFQ